MEYTVKMLKDADVENPEVIVIPATQATDEEGEEAVVRVAAYCRVSTGEESQRNSYETQISHYRSFIEGHAGWRLVKVFADEGLSGTQMAHRKAFQQMLRYARKGRLDLVLCKSISRFARNTVDLLDATRELKALGVGIIFEKENIDTRRMDSEFVLSLFASFAQAESESISRNITWGIERSFRNGHVRYRLENMLGYRKGADGRPEIVEDEAEIVRDVFRLFAGGMSMGEIARIMTERGAVRRCGSSVWSRKNVEKILKNEKYAGHAILQKTFTADCLTHARMKNTGQKPKYMILNCHEAIIDQDTYEKVQQRWNLRS